MDDAILVLNAGSSSIKFAIYALGQPIALRYSGMVQGLAGDQAHLVIKDGTGTEVHAESLPGAGYEQALDKLTAKLGQEMAGMRLRAVGHRVVHGGTGNAGHRLLDEKTFKELERLSPLAPLHQPHNLAAVRRLLDTQPDLPQVACFDTAFHRSQPWVAQQFALPRKYTRDGVLRYGFHGLSYQFIAGWLAANRPGLHDGRVVVAHLGNGASLCGLHGGRSIVTSMGFTALDGLPMGQRCGNLDPGVVLYLMEHYGMNVREVEDVLYRQSGLLGMSGESHDMRTLLASNRIEAHEALAVYCYRAAREIGSAVAALRGLDGLVFTAGVGEKAGHVRALICEQLQWLGIHLDEQRNQADATDIGRDGSLPVLVVPTDEEGEIARATLALINT